MTLLGATPHDDGSTTFLLWAPHARTAAVELAGDDAPAAERGGTENFASAEAAGATSTLTDRGGSENFADSEVTGATSTLAPSSTRTIELVAQRRGYWCVRVPGVAAGARYGFRVTHDEDAPGGAGGDVLLPDPASRLQPDGVHGSSQVVDMGAHAWRDAGWNGVPLEDYVLYELHVGTFTPEGTFAAAAARLAELAELGITAVELMPVAEFPGARNWGYDGVDLFAAHSAYGGPHALQAIVDEAHANGIAVVLDVVYNHLGPEGNYLGQFGPYFTDAHHTPWGEGVNVDGAGSDEVRRFFIENALHWLRDCHVDALRLDAIHGIVDTSATPFLAELADAVAAEAERSGRHLHLIAESDLNDVKVITPRAEGGYGHDTQWTDDFHHALHVALTGESHGYLADFATPVAEEVRSLSKPQACSATALATVSPTRTIPELRGGRSVTSLPGALANLATSLRRGFLYTGQYSEGRQRRHGNDSTGLPPERFVVCAQNHDQIGNRLLGDRLAAALTPAQQRLALATVLLSPFLPMLFMGEEYGETAPFPYFVSHGDRKLVRLVREGRAREFPPTSEGAAPDPQAEGTFDSAKLDWSLREHPGHAETLAFTRELLRLRRAHASIRTHPEAVRVIDGAALVIERAAGAERTSLLLNFSSERLTLADAGIDPASTTTLLTTAANDDATLEPFGARLLAVPTDPPKDR